MYRFIRRLIFVFCSFVFGSMTFFGGNHLLATPDQSASPQGDVIAYRHYGGGYGGGFHRGGVGRFHHGGFGGFRHGGFHRGGFSNGFPHNHQWDRGWDWRVGGLGVGYWDNIYLNYPDYNDFDDYYNNQYYTTPYYYTAPDYSQSTTYYYYDTLPYDEYYVPDSNSTYYYYGQ